MTATPPAPAPAPSPVEDLVPPMPTWSDATSVATFITAGIGTIVSGLTLFDPGIVPEVTSLEHALVPSVAAIIAGVAVVANVARHALVHQAAVTAKAAVKVAKVTAGTTA
jgi:hypothetical protein